MKVMNILKSSTFHFCFRIVRYDQICEQTKPTDADMIGKLNGQIMTIHGKKTFNDMILNRDKNLRHCSLFNFNNYWFSFHRFYQTLSSIWTYEIPRVNFLHDLSVTFDIQT